MSITALTCIFVALLLCLGMVDVGMFISAHFRAENAADAAALAGVQESFPFFGTGSGARSTASKIAVANGASLESIKVSSGGDRVQVEVSVSAPSLILSRVGLGSRRAHASAAAEVDMEAFLSSNHVWAAADPATLSRLKSIAGRLSGDPGGAATLVTLLALSHLGQPYVWGATGPNAFDCSGLVCYVYAQIGIRLPRVTFSQVQSGREVSPVQLAPGDLVFFRHNAHVGIYLGGGWFIHAPHTGDVVKVSPLSARTDLSACRRIL